MRVNKEYRKWINDDNAVRRARAHAKAEKEAQEVLARRQSEVGNTGGNYQPKSNVPEIRVQVPVGGTNVNVGVPMSAVTAAIDRPPAKDDWEKLYDESTKQFYYHNHSTGETRWEAPA